MADKGWVAIHRSIRDHWLYQEKRVFSKYEAWLDLLMDANHQNNKFLFDGQLIEIERGQFITSIRQLCDRWGWSNSKVNRFLKMLEDDQMLNRKSDTKKTVITIANYDFYQRYESNKTTAKRQQSDTKATQKHTNNNDITMINNENNIVVEEGAADLPNVIQAYESIFGIANPFIIENLQHWCNDLSPVLVIEALRESAEGNAYSFKYTETIMRNWEKQNVKSIEDVKALNQSRKNKNAPKNKLQNTGSDEYDDLGF